MAAPLVIGIGGLAASIGGKVVGGLLRAKAAIAQGEADQRAALENAKRLEDKANFTEIKTEEEVVRFNRIRDDVNATARAESGASGLKLSGSVLAIISSNAIETQRDVDIVRTIGSREAAALRSDAEIVREQGLAALSAARQKAFAEKIGAAFGAGAELGKAFPIGGTGISSLKRTG